MVLRFKSRGKMRAMDILFALSLLLQDAGTFGVLPLNIFQIILLLMLVVYFVLNLRNEKSLRVPKNFLILMVYITFITFINKWDFDSIKSVGFFALELITIYWYVAKSESYERIFKVLYTVAFILAIYGIVQEIAFIINVPAIYDISLYGFAKNGSYITENGLMRAMSLYAEPSHTSAILSWGILIGLMGIDKKYNFISFFKTSCIFVYAVLTLSTIVYLSVGLILILYVLLYQRKLVYKIRWFLLALIVLIILYVFKGDMILSVFGKLNSFKTLETNTGNDLSALAVVSNFDIAVEKLRDGYIFGTGFDSHRLYYYDYINRIYNSLYMYLNYTDAASMYIRIFSEFGIVGFVLFLGLNMRKLYLSIRRKDMIMLSFVAVFLINLLRNGSYNYITSVLCFVVIFLIPNSSNRKLKGE